MARRKFVLRFIPYAVLPLQQKFKRTLIQEMYLDQNRLKCSVGLDEFVKFQAPLSSYKNEAVLKNHILGAPICKKGGWLDI